MSDKTNEVVREPEIRRALDENQDELQTLDDLSLKIALRFTDVLRASEPNKQTDRPMIESSVPLANEIYVRTEKLCTIRKRLQEILDLCEL